MSNQHGSPDTLEQHKHEVCNAFARAAAAMRDAAQTAENFSNWFSRVNNLQNVPVPPMFNGGQYSLTPGFGGSQQPYSPVEGDTSKKRKAAGDPEGKPKRQVKEKKIKDPNAPKRPASPYLLFQNEVRRSIKAQHPEMSNTDILGEVSKLWHALTPEQKAPYNQANANMKADYVLKKADYDAEAPAADVAKSDAPKKKAAAAAVASTGVSKSTVPANHATTSDDSSDESSESSSGDGSEDDDDEEEEEIEPEPPKKKSKKETKVATPPMPKATKKNEKSVEGKKRKKTES